MMNGLLAFKAFAQSAYVLCLDSVQIFKKNLKRREVATLAEINVI
jgi:hypothetical protein